MKAVFIITALIINSASSCQDLPAGTTANISFQNERGRSVYDQANKQESKKRSLMVPVVAITYGFLALENDGLKQLDISTAQELREDHSGFAVRIDDYLQYFPGFTVYGLHVLGVKGKNTLRDETIIYAFSSLIASVAVTGIKRITKKQRPAGSAFLSFPSGHTTTAFQGAEFLRQEYRKSSPWYGVGGYSVALATGVLRVYNKRHWISDVVAGAGIGMLSTKLSYWIYPSIKNKLFKKKKIKPIILSE